MLPVKNSVLLLQALRYFEVSDQVWPDQIVHYEAIFEVSYQVCPGQIVHYEVKFDQVKSCFMKLT